MVEGSNRNKPGKTTLSVSSVVGGPHTARTHLPGITSDRYEPAKSLAFVSVRSKGTNTSSHSVTSATVMSGFTGLTNLPHGVMSCTTSVTGCKG